MVSGVQVLEDGRFVPREKSWLISYDANQLSWARQDLVARHAGRSGAEPGEWHRGRVQ